MRWGGVKNAARAVTLNLKEAMTKYKLFLCIIDFAGKEE
jgi:hypothetical protein